MGTPQDPAAGPAKARRLYVYNGGFLARGRVRRIVELAGYDIAIGLPQPDGLVGVWGNSPTAHRGEAVAGKRDANLHGCQPKAVLPFLVYLLASCNNSHVM